MGMKKLVPKWRSEKSNTSAASKTLKETSTSSDATSHDQTVSGIRISAIPSQRSPTIVARMLTEPIHDAMQKMARLASHMSKPSAWPGPAEAMGLNGGGPGP